MGAEPGKRFLKQPAAKLERAVVRFNFCVNKCRVPGFSINNKPQRKLSGYFMFLLKNLTIHFFRRT